MLRNLLLLGQEDHVKFGKCFERYEPTPSGVKAFFSDGTSKEGTLLVELMVLLRPLGSSCFLTIDL